MAQIEVEVTYKADSEAKEIISLCERLLGNMSEDKGKVQDFIQSKMQEAFDSGRRFQKSHTNIETS